jgi:RNA polymerase sigma-70 factor, ECF subfamily
MDDSDPSDEELMRRVQAGDRGAYERLYGRWRQPVFAFLVRRTGSRVRADDAHQEAWLRVFRSARTFDLRRSFRSWLFAIAANAGTDATRREADLLQLSPEPNEPEGLRERLDHALDAIGADDRKLLLLAVEGFDSAEIGAMLGIQAGTVRVRLHRARERVRQIVGLPDA